MGRKVSRKKYIHNVASNLMQEFKVKVEDFFSLTSIVDIGGTLYEQYGDWVYGKVSEMTDEAVGRLAACGVPDDPDPQHRGTSLWDVRGRNEWLSGRWPGADILHDIAQTAIIAAMCDLIIEQHPRKQQVWRS